ncbi:hypothetical protein EJ08DRAFT_653184 [Tothia fuscella]|uniref:Protein with SprT-like domain at the N terminus n=1 Tax=Tothia fuscella TaxID=1048955 RepID=A0A9P4NIE8_9PEZI|nr:hypothetical protein EJ08DRAFT_653184 [Tothia fuscella]
MAPTDTDTAIAAITSLNELSQEQQNALSSITSILADSHPFVDIHELFSHYNVLYFRSLLHPRVEVTWSARLTLCAGICELVKDDEGKYRRIRLKLSEPLLKYRPRSDTIDTLLHEAIHAYFFVTTSWQHSRGDDGTGHGEGFLLLADAINNHGNYDITVYHTFHDEVDSYRTHVWKCDGPCQIKPPYFGLVKRSMNRPPGKGDTWWTNHGIECGGEYTKIVEPEKTKAQLRALSGKERAGLQKNKLDGWVKALAAGQDDKPKVRDDSASLDTYVQSPTGSGNPLEAFSVGGDGVTTQRLKRMHSPDLEITVVLPKRMVVTCPICEEMVVERDINDHLDKTHPG